MSREHQSLTPSTNSNLNNRDNTGEVARSNIQGTSFHTSGLLKRSPFIQPKLKFGRINDRYEQEADRTARQVMNSPTPTTDTRQEIRNPGTKSAEPQVMRSSDPDSAAPCKSGCTCSKCKNKNKTGQQMVQSKPQPGSQSPSSGDSPGRSHINDLGVSGSGQPLSPSLRTFFEPRFNHDFSRVRLHTQDSAGEAARELGARAFTVGRDIVFGNREYRPDSSAGKELLAHELTHVIQQENSPGNPPRIDRKPDHRLLGTLTGAFTGQKGPKDCPSHGKADSGSTVVAATHSRKGFSLAPCWSVGIDPSLSSAQQKALVRLDDKLKSVWKSDTVPKGGTAQVAGSGIMEAQMEKALQSRANQYHWKIEYYTLELPGAGSGQETLRKAISSGLASKIRLREQPSRTFVRKPEKQDSVKPNMAKSAPPKKAPSKQSADPTVTAPPSKQAAGPAGAPVGVPAGIGTGALCGPTNRTQPNREHRLIQQDYLTNIVTPAAGGAKEYKIPQSSPTGITGYADLVDMKRFELYEIKSAHPGSIASGFVEVDRYEDAAKQHCDPRWKAGNSYPPHIIHDPTNKNQVLLVGLFAPGLILYAWMDPVKAAERLAVFKTVQSAVGTLSRLELDPSLRGLGLEAPLAARMASSLGVMSFGAGFLLTSPSMEFIQRIGARRIDDLKGHLDLRNDLTYTANFAATVLGVAAGAIALYLGASMFILILEVGVGLAALLASLEAALASAPAALRGAIVSLIESIKQGGPKLATAATAGMILISGNPSTAAASTPAPLKMEPVQLVPAPHSVPVQFGSPVTIGNQKQYVIGIAETPELKIPGTGNK